MAGKAKSVYITVVKSDTHRNEFSKMFFNAKGAADWINENLEKYPKPEYYFVKETY